MNKAYLLTGGNLGNRKSNLRQALDQISVCCGTIVGRSALYETAAWGKTDQPAFLNQALVIDTAFAPEQLLAELLRIEEEIGRVRKEKFGARVIDIDILLYGDHVMKSATLIIPHPQLAFRRFALTPLAEVAPQAVHPLSLKTIAQLLDDCTDELEVKKVE